MNTIKYTSHDAGQLQFAAAVRRNVHQYFKERNLSTKGNSQLLIQTLSMLAIYLIPFALILSVPMSPWLALLLSLIMGVGIAGVGMCVMHDAVHGSYSGKEWINTLFGSSLYLLGANVFNWRVQHNLMHHTHTNVEGFDSDIDSKGPIRLSENAPLRPFHRYQHIHAFFFYGLMTLSKLVQDFVQLAEYNRAGITRQMKKSPVMEYVKLILIKALYFGIFLGLTFWLTSFTWWQILIGFTVMHWVAGFILSVIFQLAHVVEGAEQPLPNAEGIIESDWAVHELVTTANFGRNNKLLTWYVGGLNFQIEHHLFPHICHVHYKHIAPIVEETAKSFGLPYNQKRRFRDAIWSHVRRLKELGQPALPQAA